jgi:glycosyltransferase involved in cell wall biosynthesis
MTSPFFSIIIPTYNRPDFLFRAIESGLQQTFQDFEVLVINDGSNKGLDAYEEITKKCDSLSSSIFFFTKENGGVSSARNLGIERAKGQYICFLDDDDYYLPNHLEKLFELIKKNNYSIGFYRTFTKFLNNKGELIDQPITEFIGSDNKGTIDYLFRQVIVPVNILYIKKYFTKPYI